MSMASPAAQTVSFSPDLDWKINIPGISAGKARLRRDGLVVDLARFNQGPGESCGLVGAPHVNVFADLPLFSEVSAEPRIVRAPLFGGSVYVLELSDHARRVAQLNVLGIVGERDTPYPWGEGSLMQPVTFFNRGGLGSKSISALLSDVQAHYRKSSTGVVLDGPVPVFVLCPDKTGEQSWIEATLSRGSC